jgi:hypothetical protein
VRSVRRALALAVSLAVVGASPALAASSYSRVLHTYETQGTVPACQFSAATLQSALRGVDVYGQQYFADFTDAIQSALAQRASGECRPSTPSGELATARPDPSLRLTLPAVTASTSAGPPLPLLALLILGALAVVLAVVAAVRRRLALDTGPGGAWRQLWGEAAWRSEGWLAEQRDRRAQPRRRL